MQTISKKLVKMSVCFMIILLMSWQLLTPSISANEYKITPSDGEAGQQFGASASLSGDYAVFGALYDQDDGTSAGAAYVFQRTGATWSQQAKIAPLDNAEGDTFGSAVGISGENVVVGAIGNDDNGESSGAAYVFHRTGETWSQQAKLTPDDGAAYDYFGQSVAVSSNYAVIGSQGDRGSYQGAAYVFQRSGDTWSQQAKITPAIGDDGDRFGRSVAIEDDYIIVGAEDDDQNGVDAGAAYVYLRSGDSWIEQAKIVANDGAAGDHFGSSVALSGDDAIVGAVAADDSGAAYIFHRDGAMWNQQAKLVPNDGAPADLFGGKVAISGDYALIAAIYHDDLGENAGSIYIFRRSGTTWRQYAKINASDGASGAYFGHSVAMSTEHVIAGAIGDSQNGAFAGAAYAFDLGRSTLYSPTPYSTLPGTEATFKWYDSQADQYWLQVGTSLGGSDLYSMDQNLNTSATVSGLPYNGETVFVRLYSRLNNVWEYNDYWYTAYDYKSEWAVITDPDPIAGAELLSRNVTFKWTNAGAEQYWLQVGTALGASDLYNLNQGTGTQAYVPDLPHNGEAVYVRLWQKKYGQWFSDDYTYAAYNNASALTNYGDGVLTDTSATFNWDNLYGATQYWLQVGTSFGGSDLYNQDQQQSTTATITNLPHNGETIYVRLWSYQDGEWIYRDYTYKAVNQAAQITSPAPGTDLTSTTADFIWNHVGASKYWLYIGTTLGGHDLYSADQGINTTVSVSGLPFQGELLYVRLYSLVDGDWIYNDYMYTAYDYTSTQAYIYYPWSGSTLWSRSITFNWTNSGADQYWLYVGTSLGAHDLYSADQKTNLWATVDNLPHNGQTVYVRLWQHAYGNWSYKDHFYMAFKDAAVITSPTPGAQLASTTQTFTWSDAGADRYWMYIGTSQGASDLYSDDPGTDLEETISDLPNTGQTLYVRLWSLISGDWIYNDYVYTACNQAAAITTPTPGSTFASTTESFFWNDVSAAQYWLFIGTSKGASDLYSNSQGTNTSVTVTGLPHNSTEIYVRLWSLVGSEWLFNDHIYTACNDGADLWRPTPGTSLSATSATFVWTDADADQYYLTIGTAEGGSDVYSKDQGRNTSVSVSGLPNNGETLYVRLWSKIGGVWIYKAYTYTAANDAAFIYSPTPGSTLYSMTATFIWTDAGADQYWLSVGTSAGGSDLYSSDQGLNTSATVSGIPLNGEMIYVRLWSKIGGDWIYNDCVYQAK